jgi:tRNA pseudouridine55 synthase
MSRPPFGVINVHKPAGLSSRKVVDRVVRRARPAKAGHAGTLDPLATGVLVVCVGRATRLIPFVQDLPKAYRARFLLGRTSPTDDITGELTEHPGGEAVTLAQLEALLPRFTGRIEQVPPQFSAVHVEGQRAYKLARRGTVVELTAREVDVYRLALSAFQSPEFELEIECGSGTYVRSIGRDLGALLGCGAVMSSLVRTHVGPYTIESAVTLDDLDAQPMEDILLPPQTAVAHLPDCRITDAELGDIRAGRPFHPPAVDNLPGGTTIAVFAPDGELACLAVYDPKGRRLAPSHVFLEADLNRSSQR